VRVVESVEVWGDW
jgi:hypothetical protein